MKKFAWIGFLVIAGLLLAKGVGRAEDVKVGVVDVSKVFSAYTKVAESQVEFNKFRDERLEDVKKKVDAAKKEIKVLQDKLDTQSKAMKKEASDKLSADIGTKTQEVFNIQQEFSQELQKKNQEMVEARVKEIESVIASLAKEKGYTLILNKDMVLYFPEATDLSDQVIAALNKPAVAKK